MCSKGGERKRGSKSHEFDCSLRERRRKEGRLSGFEPREEGRQRGKERREREGRGIVGAAQKNEQTI